MSPLFYAVGANGIGYKTFAAAKVLLFFEIYKKFCTFDAELIVLGVWSKFLARLSVISRSSVGGTNLRAKVLLFPVKHKFNYQNIWNF